MGQNILGVKRTTCSSAVYTEKHGFKSQKGKDFIHIM